MTKIIRYFGIILTLVLLGFLSLSSRISTALLQTAATQGPRVKTGVLPLESQAGHSDGILILGIMIFIFIAIPIIMRYRDLR